MPCHTAKAGACHDTVFAQDYYNLRYQLRMFGLELQKIFTDPQYIVPFLNPGRLIQVSAPPGMSWSLLIACMLELHRA